MFVTFSLAIALPSPQPPKPHHLDLVQHQAIAKRVSAIFKPRLAKLKQVVVD